MQEGAAKERGPVELREAGKKKEKFFHIPPRVRGVFALALLFFSLIAGGGEITARSAAFPAIFVAFGVGSPHRQFEIQLARLEKIAASRGGIECIFLGNSQVWLGFEPLVFSEAYQEIGGVQMRCFNFGVDALTAASAGPLAQILVDKFHPQVLLYGSDPRDFTISRQDRDTTVILDTAWVQYHQGNPSLEGWLYEESALYRYRISLRDLFHFDFYSALNSWNPEPRLSERYGFYPEGGEADYAAQPPNPTDERVQIQYYYRVLSDYQLRPENIAGFEQLLGQNGKGVNLLVVGLPVPAGYYYFFGNGEQDYQVYRQEVNSLLEKWQVPVIWPDADLVFPADSWADYSHLNENGARVFSQWLGERIGAIGAFPDNAFLEP